MAADFRNEVFLACKILQKKDTAKKITSLIDDLSKSSKFTENETEQNNTHGDFAYLAKQSNNEFYSYLFIDDNIDKIELPQFLRAEHLASDERNLIESGHQTLVRFIELCLADIKQHSDVLATALNPYFLLKPIKINANATSILSDDELLPVVSAFKNGRVYKTLIDSNLAWVLSKLDINTVGTLITTAEREVNRSLGDDITHDLKEFTLKLAMTTKFSSISDVMLAYSILLIALRESLKMSCHLFFNAICGIDLLVLNNDNIINIEESISTTVCKFYKVLVQEISINTFDDDMVRVLLIDCDPSNEEHIHEFGMIIAETISFSRETGKTTKYSFVTIDKEMIHIYPLTEAIMRIGLPDEQITKC